MNNEELIEKCKVTEENRDEWLLTESEQDRAIINMLEELSFRGECELSEDTKKYASQDALCGEQHLKSIRKAIPIIQKAVPDEFESCFGSLAETQRLIQKFKSEPVKRNTSADPELGVK